MLRLAIALPLLLAGCHAIFALEDKPPIDAPGEQVVFDVRTEDVAVLADGRVCWDSTRIAHDEDGDMIKDGCDNCPAVHNDSQRNDDGDDLGDACDPHPTKLDTIAYWQGFKDPGSDAGWNVYEGYGTWKVEADAYQQTGAAEAAAATVLAGSLQNATVEVLVDGIAIPGNLETTSAGAYIWSRSEIPTSGAPDGVLCVERRAPAGDTMEIRRVGSTGVTMGEATGLRIHRTYLRFASKHDGNTGEVECIVRRGSSLVTPQVAAEASGEGFVTLYTGSTPAKFHSVLVSVTP